MSKVKWLLEPEVFDEDETSVIMALKKLDVPHVVCSFGTEYESYIKKFAEEDCVVFHGSFQFARVIQQKAKWIPGVYCNKEKLDCLYYYPRFGDYLLNSHYMMLPFGDLNRRKNDLFDFTDLAVLNGHSVLPGQNVVEIWHDGEFIGQICGADGPGIRVASKHASSVARPDHMITEVLLGVEPERTVVVCSKCGKTNIENKSKYCGDGSDKDNEHRWVKPLKIEIVEAGVGPGHPHKTCDRCGVAAKYDEDGHSDLIATCTHTEYVTLCETCYRKAGNSVR